MNNYRLIKDVGSLMRRVDDLEIRLKDIEKYEFPVFFSCERRAKPMTMKEETEEIGNTAIKKSVLYWDPWWITDDLKCLSGKLIVHSNGTFYTKTVLINHSMHKEYGINISFKLVYEDSRRYLCTFSQFSANLRPGEEETYTTSGSGDICIKTNFKLILSGEVVGDMRADYSKYS